MNDVIHSSRSQVDYDCINGSHWTNADCRYVGLASYSASDPNLLKWVFHLSMYPVDILQIFVRQICTLLLIGLAVVSYAW